VDKRLKQDEKGSSNNDKHDQNPTSVLKMSFSHSKDYEFKFSPKVQSHFSEKSLGEVKAPSPPHLVVNEE
jgi:hypothetical protein